MTLIKTSTWTKCVSFHVLHTCIKFLQPKGNNKNATGIKTHIPTVINFSEQL